MTDGGVRDLTLSALSDRGASVRPIRMGEDEAEDVARQHIAESGLDDRPRCDPRVFAASYLGLRLAPIRGSRPRLVDGVIWYPSEVSEDAQAYLVAHECGHELVRAERLEGEHLERVCSRVGVALLLPRRAFLRDLRAHGPDLAALRALWPLASEWVIARRIAEVASYTARRDRRGRIYVEPITDGAGVPPTPP